MRRTRRAVTQTRKMKPIVWRKLNHTCESTTPTSPGESSAQLNHTCTSVCAHTNISGLAMLHLLVYIIKRQLTVCFKPSKPIQTGLCMLLSMSNMVRHDICRHSYAVEKGLVVGFCGQLYYCYWPYYLTARFRSPSSYMVSDEPFLNRSRPMSC